MFGAQGFKSGDSKDPSAGTLYPGESPRAYRALFNIFPPHLFGGVRVREIADDWTSVHVTYTVRPWNRNNPNRAAFGGTLYSMTDPFFGIMAYGQLGRGYRVWNTCGGIEFIAPGRGTVSATMILTCEEVDAIRDATRDGGKSITDHSAEIVDATGRLVARSNQKLYARSLRS
jgi:acyl-coenzyme A thioesterase PaaI-like protein